MLGEEPDGQSETMDLPGLPGKQQKNEEGQAGEQQKNKQGQAFSSAMESGGGGKPATREQQQQLI